jgi:cyanophycinase
MPSPEEKPGSRGYIIPIGGAEDKVSGKEILTRFVELCGGKSARIAIIPTASQLDDTGRRYVEVFKSCGCRDTQVLDYKDRRQSDRTDWLDSLSSATGIFLTGGAQLRLSTILGGTPVAQAIRRMNARGVHVAGTSAGAAFLSEHMIAFGKDGSTPIAGNVTLTPGLGLTNRVIVDQHFRERDRLGRLLTALAYNPFAVGLGLDEDTGGFIDANNVIEIVGKGAITVADVSDLEYSSMAVVDEGQPVQLIGVRLHVLSKGAHYHLETRKASPGAEAKNSS